MFNRLEIVGIGVALLITVTLVLVVVNQRMKQLATGTLFLGS